jgi:hypothetical protein
MQERAVQRLVMARECGTVRKPWIMIPGCQGRQIPWTPNPGYGVRSRDPSSPARFFPSAAGLVENGRKEIRMIILSCYPTNVRYMIYMAFGLNKLS